MKPLTAILFSILLITGTASHAQEWPRHRGPDGSGIGTGTLPTEITEENTAWIIALPGVGHSSPVLWGDHLYLTTQPEPETSAIALLCLDPATGKQIWSQDIPFADFPVNKKFNTHASTTPVVDADHIYLSGADGQEIVIRAFSHEGEAIWERRFAGYDANDHGMIAPPLLVGDQLIVPAEHIGSGAKIAALDRITGEVNWEVAREHAKDSYSTPVAFEQKNGVTQLITVSTSHGFSALNAADGSLIWDYNPGYDQRSVGSPVLASGIVFATLGSGGGAKESAAIIPGTLDREPEVLYELSKGLPYVPSALVIDDLIYLLNDAGMLTCADLKTGHLHYDRERLSDGSSVKWFSAPITAGGVLYTCSHGGEVVAIQTGKNFTVLGRTQLDGAINACPAIAGGRVFIRTATSLYCIHQ